MKREVLVTVMLLGITTACHQEADSGSHTAPSTTSSTSTESATASTATTATVQPTFEQALDTWKKERVERLTAPTGWLTVVGLHWLAEGVNTIGSGPGSKVPLPQGKAPETLGTLTLAKGVVTIRTSAPGLTTDGKPVGEMVLKTDADPEGPTELSIGPLRFFIIQRGERYGVRVKDSESAGRAAFAGIQYFPPDPKWQVKAHFEPYNPPKSVPVQDVIGGIQQNVSPGALVFEIDGTTYRLDPVTEEGTDDFFVIFGDKTNGRDTYGAGRYLYTSRPDAQGSVTIDFNRAYNPPCSFTNFATCPLPPKQNKLPIRIEAGEKKYTGAH